MAFQWSLFYYLRRYVSFLGKLLEPEEESIEMSVEVSDWLSETSSALQKIIPRLDEETLDARGRLISLRELGEAASEYRLNFYEKRKFDGKTLLPITQIRELLEKALIAIDHTIANNKRDDGLYHAYNLLNPAESGIEINRLYPMLEGQVSVISAGIMSSNAVIENVEALFRSKVYRPDQQSFMLYPDRELPRFLEKNRIPEESVQGIPLLTEMLKRDDTRIICKDTRGELQV